MPCRCDEMETSDQYRQEADKMAAMLCSLCEMLEQQTDTAHLSRLETWPASVRKWWADHKKKDAERVAQEEAAERKQMLKRMALSKLTQEERDALGVR